jgi:hypothetical protein
MELYLDYSTVPFWGLNPSHRLFHFMGVLGYTFRPMYFSQKIAMFSTTAAIFAIMQCDPFVDLTNFKKGLSYLSNLSKYW